MFLHENVVRKSKKNCCVKHKNKETGELEA